MEIPEPETAAEEIEASEDNVTCEEARVSETNPEVDSCVVVDEIEGSAVARLECAAASEDPVSDAEAATVGELAKDETMRLEEIAVSNEEDSVLKVTTLEETAVSVEEIEPEEMTAGVENEPKPLEERAPSVDEKAAPVE